VRDARPQTPDTSPHDGGKNYADALRDLFQANGLVTKEAHGQALLGWWTVRAECCSAILPCFSQRERADVGEWILDTSYDQHPRIYDVPTIEPAAFGRFARIMQMRGAEIPEWREAEYAEDWFSLTVEAFEPAREWKEDAANVSPAQR